MIIVLRLSREPCAFLNSAGREAMESEGLKISSDACHSCAQLAGLYEMEAGTIQGSASPQEVDI